jgi:hypothetical protein
MPWPKGKPRKQQPSDPLDQLAAEGNADPKRIIALMLWQDRHRNPDMARQITERDVKGFADSMKYMEVEPEILIVRPQGHPGTPAYPAVGKRKAIPARAPEGPRQWVAVNLVRKGTQDGIKPIENNEEDAKRRDQAEEIRRWRDKAPQLARDLIDGANRGTYSTAVMAEAAQALNAMARA